MEICHQIVLQFPPAASGHIWSVCACAHTSKETKQQPDLHGIRGGRQQWRVPFLNQKKRQHRVSGNDRIPSQVVQEKWRRQKGPALPTPHQEWEMLTMGTAVTIPLSFTAAIFGSGTGRKGTPFHCSSFSDTSVVFCLTLWVFKQPHKKGSWGRHQPSSENIFLPDCSAALFKNAKLAAE